MTRATIEQVRRTKPRAKPRDLEGPIHRAILELIPVILPGAVPHHSPNEIDLASRDVARAIAKQRKNGTRKGWPDIEILWRGKFMTLEVKAGRNVPTDDQIECGRAIVEAGGRWAVVRSISEAESVLRAWREGG